MKKFLALVLALLMALSCFSFAGADAEHVHEFATEQDQIPEEALKNRPADTQATCTTHGTEYKYCKKCEKWIASTTEINPNAHEPAEGAYTFMKTEDCQQGYELWYTECKHCGKPYLYEDHTEGKKEHVWDETKTKTVEETCVSDGYVEKTCKVCGKTMKVSETPKHQPELVKVNASVVAHATCEKEGVKGEIYWCSKCHNIPEFVTIKGEKVPNYNEVEPKITEHDADLLFRTEKIGDVKYFKEFTEDFAKLLTKTTDKDFTETVDASKAPFYYGEKMVVTYKAPVNHKTDGSLTITCSCGNFTVTVPVYCGKHTYELYKIEYAVSDKATTAIYAQDIDWTGFNAETDDAAIWAIEHCDKKENGTVYDCTIPMVATYKCSCKDEQTAEVSWQHEHTWNPIEYVYVDALNGEQKVYDIREVPTCVSYTVKSQCANCTQSKTEEKAATTDHNLEEVAASSRPSTCLVPGMKVEVCGCGLRVITELPLKAHSSKNGTPYDPDETVVKNATCTEKGSATYTCKVCKKTWTEEIPTLSGDGKHHFEEIIDTAATCTKPGKAHKECSICKEKQEAYTIPAAHKFGHLIGTPKNVAKKADGTLVLGKDGFPVWANCAEDGHYDYECAVCCKAFSADKKASAHEWEDESKGTKSVIKYEFVNDTTCRASYTLTVKCKNCNEEDVREVVGEGKHVHEGEDEFVVVKPTCEKEGEAINHCQYCKAAYKSPIEKTGHVYVSTFDKVANKWTYKCQTCGVTKDFNFGLPSYTVDTTGITKGSRTNGTGVLVPSTDVIPVVSNVYVYIRWTYTLRDGDDFIFEDVRTVNDDLTFSAKGPTAPAGSTLTKVTIIATNDPAADDKDYDSMVKYGYTIMK